MYLIIIKSCTCTKLEDLTALLLESKVIEVVEKAQAGYHVLHHSGAEGEP
jgi:hypothetical protein